MLAYERTLGVEQAIAASNASEDYQELAIPVEGGTLQTPLAAQVWIRE